MDKETLQLLLEIREIAENNLCINCEMLSNEDMQIDMASIAEKIEAHLLERINK